MKTIYESSNRMGNAHIFLVKYRNLHNISHYHDDHELIYIHSGSAWLTVNETSFHMHGGECALVQSNDIHYIQSDANTVISVAKADCEYFGNIFTSKKLSSPILQGQYDTEAFLKEIWEEQKAPGEYSDLLIDCTATKFFAALLRKEKSDRTAPTTPRRSNSQEIYAAISQKVFTDYSTITFDEAAKYMHFSKPYFSKVFHRIFGMTFTQYLNTIKVSFAIEKINQGNVSMTEVSASCGFNTIRNFNRVFKELTGYAPNSLPPDYVFIHHLRDASGLDPTLNSTVVLE